MTQYLLSVHAVDGAAPPPMTEEELRAGFHRIAGLEEELQASGAWVFSGRLTAADVATVVRRDGGELLTTDGPFVEAKEHIAGFYVIEAEDLDAALAWAAKVTEVTGEPIEVRPFWERPAT